ncbi:hypothetical protein BB560_004195 [Smittium megazygosporum]|uniref:Uncharacterized protein n=1 Tax=Smittium megazygosporum TaxID=133381 RepID=A0A2T9Z9Y3_9FUNG|nr:hypothetical protein BB560_004195 [Smittium megazygosporum]
MDNSELFNIISELFQKVNTLLSLKNIDNEVGMEDEFILPKQPNERTNILSSSVKTVDMNYNPPPINDNVNDHVKREDYHYYKLQKFLAQATRPIDSYVHSLLVLEPEIYSEDTRILFASTMRILLSEAATMLTQARIDNLHYGLKLPGEPIQIMKNNDDPLLNQVALNELLALRKAKRSNKLNQHRAATSNNADTPVESLATAQTFKQTGTKNPGYTSDFPKGPWKNRGKGKTLQYVDESINTKETRITIKSQRKEIQEGYSSGNRRTIKQESHHKGNFNSYITGNTNEQNRNKPKEFHSEDYKELGLYSYNYRLGTRKPFMVEGEHENMEWEQFPSGSIGVGSFYMFKRIWVGNHYRIQSIFSGLVNRGTKETYQLKIIVNYFNCSTTQGDHGEVDYDILQQDKYHILYKEVWGHIILIATGTSREDMEALSKCWNRVTGQLYPINFKSSGCPFTHDYTDRVVIEGRCVQEDPTSTWKEQRKHICFWKEQEASKLLFVIPGYRSNCNKSTAPQMENIGKSICLSAMESDTECDSESSPRKAKNDNNHTTLDYINMVSRITGSISEATTHNSSDCSNSGSQEREVSIRKEQDLVPNGLEHKRKTLSDQVNFLAKGLIEDKIFFSSVKTYKSALIQLCDDPKSIATSPCFKEFFTALKETSIKSFIRPSYDVTPIINELITWGPSDKLGISKLTSKLCWLISICGFLRASYINRIDDSLTAISNDTIKFVIIAPKEKHNDHPILKLCGIRSRSNPILCPVGAYKEYKEFTRTIIFKKHHPNRQEIELLILMRHSKDLQKALGVDSITRRIQTKSSFMPMPPNSNIPKDRALGSTLASASRIPSDNIVAHAFWSNYDVFNNHYRLSRSTNSNITGQGILT